MLKSGERYEFIVKSDEVEKRLDVFLTEQFPDYSRSFFKDIIEQSAVTVNGKCATKAGTSLKENAVVIMTIPTPPVKEAISTEVAQTLGVSLVHQEDDFAIIEKPAGIVVHPPKKHSTDLSLLDWLGNTFQNIQDVGYADRPGIVHRLDKDTTGLMIIPLTNNAHAIFSDMFKNRQIHKTYSVIVHGHPEPTGTISFPIGRDPHVRNKMKHSLNGRASETCYSAIEYFDDHAFIKAEPVTGRTHQIRVHFTRIGHPLVGDVLYGTASHHIKRHALHATELKFNFNGRDYHFVSPLPDDIKQLLTRLRKS